ncbi:MAG: hypothetical protein HUJ97_03560 [Bacteroidales bacterium]|nr:hypothetical protein [Bacteroidales bacterium]
MTTKPLKDYIRKRIRNFKYRKGFGVHSPFAYNFITEVVEEKTPYYSYTFFQKIYTKQSPVPFKLAAFLLRLSNRFHARKIIEIGSDGGQMALPIIVTDSHNRIYSLANEETEIAAKDFLSVLNERQEQITYKRTVEDIPEDFIADMVLLSYLPDGYDANKLFEYLKLHTHEKSIFFVKGIQPKQKMEKVWDIFCDDENIQITMDMFDYGLAIRRPRFFKQHYIVSF